jgi:hypothetical protein
MRKIVNALVLMNKRVIEFLYANRFLSGPAIKLSKGSAILNFSQDIFSAIDGSAQLCWIDSKYQGKQ